MRGFKLCDVELNAVMEKLGKAYFLNYRKKLYSMANFTFLNTQIGKDNLRA